MAYLADSIWVNVSTSGTADFTTTTALAGYRTFADASTPNGSTIHYSARSATQFENGEGIYSSGTGVVTRATIFASSSAGAKVNFSVSPTLVVAPLAEDFGDSALTIGTTTITGGTTTRVLYEAAGNVVGESSAFTIASNQPNVVSGSSYLYNGVNVLRAVTADSNWWLAGAGNLTATGTINIGIGGDFSGLTTLELLTSGSNNVAIGDGAFALNTSGTNNIGIGFLAGRTNDTGSNNVAIGAQSLSGAIGGTHAYSACVAIGSASMDNATGGASCVAIGSNTLRFNTSGSGNIAVGASALAANTDGIDNLALGFSSLAANTTGDSNIAIGASSLVGSNGNNNVAIGAGAGGAVTSGETNTILGYAEATISSGNRNISIGAQCGVPTATASGQLVIGNYIYGTGLNSTGATISSGKIGIGIKAPNYNLDIVGDLGITGFEEFTESTAPSAPAANKARLYVQDNGSGKTQLCILFPSGAAQVIATEP